MKGRISLEKWANAKFDPPPCPETRRRWVRDCKIWPRPQKIGRAYYVQPDAEYRDPTQIGRVREMTRGT